MKLRFMMEFSGLPRAETQVGTCMQFAWTLNISRKHGSQGMSPHSTHSTPSCCIPLHSTPTHPILPNPILPHATPLHPTPPYTTPCHPTPPHPMPPHRPHPALPHVLSFQVKSLEVGGS